MPALPTSIVSSITGLQPLPRLKQVYLWAIDTADDEVVPWANGGGAADFAARQSAGAKGGNNATKIALQYWPESLSDNRSSEWNPRNIPGGSHPIYQWTRGGERRLSFTAVFARDHEPDDSKTTNLGGFLKSAASAIGLGPQEGDPAREPPIEAAIKWLRYFTYPLYREGSVRVSEPPKIMLVFPNSGLAHDGSEGLVTVMTGCDVTYEAWFPNGKPRIVEVQLEFAEVVQRDNSVRFHSRGDMIGAADVTSMAVFSGQDGSILEKGVGGL